jgi:hypothetical protein
MPSPLSTRPPLRRTVFWSALVAASAAAVLGCSSLPPPASTGDAGPGTDGAPSADAPPADGAQTADGSNADGSDAGGTDLAPPDLPPVDEITPPPSDMTSSAMSAVGTACTTNNDCGANGFCATEATSGLPGGYCTTGCDPAAAGSCGPGNDCLTLGQTILCVRTCTADSDCRDGYGCATTFFGAALGDGSRVCAAGKTDAKPGDPCTGIRDCAPGSGFCLGETDSGFPGGYCSAQCDATDPTSCGDGGACVETAFGDFCAGTCTAGGTTCRDGYQCAGGFYGGPSDVDVCAPGLAAPVPVGSPCADEAGCGAGNQLCFQDSSGYPGGYCSQGCDPRTAGSCGDGYCLAPDPANHPSLGVCLAGCPAGDTGNDACTALRTGDSSGTTYGCTARIFGYPLPGGGHVCLPYEASASLGDPCVGTGNCALGTTCLTAMQGFPDGYCSDVCNPTNISSCGDGAVCWPLDPQMSASGGVCLLRCSADTDCRSPGYACTPTGSGGADPACIPQ